MPSQTPVSVTVLGSGSWGIALAHLLWRNGHAVSVYSIENLDIFEKEILPHRLPDFELPKDIHLTNDLNEALAGADYLFAVVPSDAYRELARQLARATPAPDKVVLVSCGKGIETDSLKRLTEVLAEELDGASVRGIVALSGPSFALEVVRELPTSVVIAGEADEAREVQVLLRCPTFRPYTSHDVVGTELGGAFKNVLAIAAGLSDGLGFGHNTKAALVTRGQAEISRVGVRLGADIQTFSGLSGIGDLMLTCTGNLSRNREFGERIGRGMAPDDAIAAIGMTVEGSTTARCLQQLCTKYDVEMPICEEVANVLFHNKPPQQAVLDLMLREPKPEMELENQE